jgi:hypothetical protein
MPDLTNWLGTGGEGQPAAIATIIGYKSVSTGTITRGATTASAVTVRLETLSGQREIQGEGGMTYLIDAMILAAYGADLKVGDRFTVSSRTFEIVAIMPGHTDCLQAYLKARS